MRSAIPLVWILLLFHLIRPKYLVHQSLWCVSNSSVRRVVTVEHEWLAARELHRHVQHAGAQLLCDLPGTLHRGPPACLLGQHSVSRPWFRCVGRWSVGYHRSLWFGRFIAMGELRIFVHVHLNDFSQLLFALIWPRFRQVYGLREWFVQEQCVCSIYP